MTNEQDIIKRLERIEKMTLLASKNVLTLEETAIVTGYTVNYLRQLIAQREIPHYKRGNRLFFNRDEIEDWMMAERIPSRGEYEALAIGYTRK
jgi:excisionase family DNA binding protein